MAIQPFRATLPAPALLTAGLFLAPAYAEGPMSWSVGGATDETHVEVLRGGWGYEPSGSQRGFSVRGALELHRNFELELGAMSASNLHWSEYLSGYQGYLNAHTTFDVKALNVSAVGKVVGRTFEGYIKAGIARYGINGSQVLGTLLTEAAATRPVHASDFDYLLGAGFFIKPAPKWRVRVEYQYFAVERDFLGISSDDDPSVDTFSIGFDYRLPKRQTSQSSPQ